jgi:RNA polymerase sigma-70 factor, ECF subfamily
MRMTQRRSNDSDVGSPFQLFFAAEQQRLLVVALALAPDREVARDAVQEALARTFARWEEISKFEQPAAWTRRVLINLLIDNHRRSMREHVAVARWASRDQSVTHQPEVDEFLALVRDLPQRQRAAVALHYLADLSIEQVAATMNVADGTVKALLFKARHRLSALVPKEQLS